MTVDEAKTIVERHIRWFKWGMGLTAWTINVYYQRLSENVQGECSTDVRYLTATVTIDNDQVDDAERLLYVLRHEFLHILHAEFDHALNCAIEEFDGTTEKNLLWQMKRSAQERTVRALEFMLDCGLGVTPDRLMDMAALQARRDEIDDFEEPILPQDLSATTEKAS